MNQLENIRNYWNIRADGYSRSVCEELKESGGKWAEKLEKVLGSASGKKALDIGCGPGMFSVILTQLGCEVTAFDYSEEMLARARKNVEQTGKSAVFVRGDAQNLPFPEGSFDLVVSRNLTWNLEHPKRAYQEWLRVLKNGGSILNFDGNHYLHYYNERYRQAREVEGIVSGSGHKYMEHVDVRIIDGIARDLPLSREERPAWDLNTLLALEVQSLETEIGWRLCGQGEKQWKIIDSFMIHAVKGA